MKLDKVASTFLESAIEQGLEQSLTVSDGIVRGSLRQQLVDGKGGREGFLLCATASRNGCIELIEKMQWRQVAGLVAQEISLSLLPSGVDDEVRNTGQGRIQQRRSQLQTGNTLLLT
jgi:hypothetical protein